MITITNTELQELDKEVAQFYKLCARYLDSLHNLYARDIYNFEASQILRKLEQIKPGSELDELIIKNTESNIRINNLVYDFITNPNFSLTIEDFLNKIAGPESFEYIQERMKSPPWKKRWKHTEITQERDLSSVNRFTDEAKEAAKIWIPKIKDDVITYGKQEGYLPEDFDMNIFLIPPKDGIEISNWNSFNNTLNLGFYGFRFLNKDGKVIAVPTNAYETAFHEVLGHASHQYFSRDLPASVKFTEEIGTITATKPITEGVALNRQKISHLYLRKRLDDLKLPIDDISALESEIELYHQNNAERIYCAMLNERASKDKEFDIYKHLLDLTNNHIVANSVKNSFKDRFVNIWGALGHTFGPLRYKDMEDIIKQRFGREYFDREHKKINQATATGVWSWEVYPDAVSYFLRNK